MSKNIWGSVFMIYLYDSLVAFVVKVLTNFVSLAVYDTKEMGNWSKNLLRRFFKCKFSNAKRKEKRIVTFFTTHLDGEMMKTVIKMIIMVRCLRLVVSFVDTTVKRLSAPKLSTLSEWIKGIN